MKRIRFWGYLTLFSALLLLLLLAGCGKSPDPDATAAPVPQATEPTTTGAATATTLPIATTAWDGEVCEIRWVIWHDLIRTYVSPGDLPVPPDEATRDIETDESFYRFRGWETDPVPAEGKVTTYTALYDSEPRLYTVKMNVDGEVRETLVPYGDEPTWETPAGTRVLWASSARVTRDAELFGTVVSDSEGVEELRWALAEEPRYFGPSDPQDAVGGVTPSVALFEIVLAFREGKVNQSVLLRRINDHVSSLFSGGSEPVFGCSCYWTYPIMAGAFALIRNTPGIWDTFPQETKDRADLLMACFAVASNFGTDDQNDYKTGPNMVGNYNKGWNPNFKLANVVPILFSVAYFGSADAVDELFLNFDYDAYIAKFDEYGWTRAKESWTHPSHTVRGRTTRSAKQLLTAGGQATSSSGSDLGSGVGVKGNTYSYQNHPLSDIPAIVNAMLLSNYAGGRVVNEVRSGTKTVGRILDGTSSPMLGRAGMMTEFNSSDANGTRSSLAYCTKDFVMAIVMLTGLEELGCYDVESPDNASQIALCYVGNTDFIYKAKHGYGSTGTTGSGTYLPWGEGCRVCALLWETRLENRCNPDLT